MRLSAQTCERTGQSEGFAPLKRRKARMMSVCLALALFGLPGAASAAALAPPGIVGFCLFARGTAIRQSRAGSAARQRMVQFEEDLANTLRKQRAMLDMEDRTLAEQQAKLSPGEFQSRLATLKGRLADLDQAKTDGAARIERTRTTAQSRIDATLDPLLNRLFAERGCVVLMERNNAYIYATQLDLTGEVVKRLDTVLSAFEIPFLAP